MPTLVSSVRLMGLTRLCHVHHMPPRAFLTNTCSYTVPLLGISNPFANFSSAGLQDIMACYWDESWTNHKDWVKEKIWLIFQYIEEMKLKVPTAEFSEKKRTNMRIRFYCTVGHQNCIADKLYQIKKYFFLNSKHAHERLHTLGR